MGKSVIGLGIIGLLCIALFSCEEGTEEEVNIYTHRHYDTDQELFAKFTEKTGIKVNVVNATADELIQKMEMEGANSPANLLITVDAGRLVRAEKKGLFQPIQSDIINQNIPAKFRDPDGYWTGLTYRARIIANAVKLIEYLSEVEAQSILANLNFEYPINSQVELSNLLQSWGNFKGDDINLSVLGENNPDAVMIFDRIGWK